MHAKVAKDSELREVFPELAEVFFKSEKLNKSSIKELIIGKTKDLKIDFDVNKTIHTFSMKVIKGDPLVLNSTTGFEQLQFPIAEKYWGIIYRYENEIKIEATFLHKDIKGISSILDKNNPEADI